MENTPNVILIIMDDVRADHLSCYGYDRKTAANIDRIARHGILYENAFSAAPWTPPSHASIFTGKYPSHHKTLGRNIYLKKDNMPVAEILSRRGYRCFGVTCCSLLGLGTGFEKGFHEYVQVGGDSSYSNVKADLKNTINTLVRGHDRGTYLATEIIKSFLERQSNEKTKPFFLFVNYFNCHTPYDPPRPFKRRFCKGFDRSKFYMKDFILNRILNKTTDRIFDPDLNIHKLRWIASGEGGISFVIKEVSVSQKEWEIVKSWYDGEIAYLDYRIGNLVEFLYEKGFSDNTLLIVTSDHGENFGDHGLAGHPLCVYDSLLHVPLIMSYPDMIPEGKRISGLASTVDIFPSIMEVLGIKFEEGIQGESLYPFENRKIHDFVCAEYGGLFAQAGFSWQVSQLSPSRAHAQDKLKEIDRGCKCIRTLTHKYILTNGNEELYDTSKDEYEQVNIATEYPNVTRYLRQKMEETIDTSYFGTETFSEADEKEMVKRLKALGYF